MSEPPTVKLTKNPRGSGYLWTNPATGERFEVWSIKKRGVAGPVWHANGDKGARVQDVNLSGIREKLAAHQHVTVKAAR